MCNYLYNTFRGGKFRRSFQPLSADDVVTTQACQNSIEMFQELKQWICWWPYSNSDNQLPERPVTFIGGLYTPASIEVVCTYQVNDLYTFSTIPEKYLISTVCGTAAQYLLRSFPLHNQRTSLSDLEDHFCLGTNFCTCCSEVNCKVTAKVAMAEARVPRILGF